MRAYHNTISKFNRKDDDGHKYNIPVKLLSEFDTMLAAMQKARQPSDEWDDACDKFIDSFYDYMVG